MPVPLAVLVHVYERCNWKLWAWGFRHALLRTPLPTVTMPPHLGPPDRDSGGYPAGKQTLRLAAFGG